MDVLRTFPHPYAENLKVNIVKDDNVYGIVVSTYLGETTSDLIAKTQSFDECLKRCSSILV